MTPIEAAAIIGVTPLKLRQYVRDGLIKGVKTNGSWELDENSVRAFVKPKRQPKASKKPVEPGRVINSSMDIRLGLTYARLLAEKLTNKKVTVRTTTWTKVEAKRFQLSMCSCAHEGEPKRTLEYTELWIDYLMRYGFVEYPSLTTGYRPSMAGLGMFVARRPFGLEAVHYRVLHDIAHVVVNTGNHTNKFTDQYVKLVMSFPFTNEIAQQLKYDAYATVYGTTDSRKWVMIMDAEEDEE